MEALHLHPYIHGQLIKNLINSSVNIDLGHNQPLISDFQILLLILQKFFFGELNEPFKAEFGDDNIVTIGRD